MTSTTHEHETRDTRTIRAGGLTFSGLHQAFLRMTSLARQRRRLRGLPDHLLLDVGLTRDEAQEEARRPFWDAPSHWKGE